MTNLAKLAAGLTPTLRKAVIQGWVQRNKAVTIKALKRRNLFWVGGDGKASPTDLCHALRRHLLDQEKG